jgi:2-iminobutanoate/2-iminopropanoate deaminase
MSRCHGALGEVIRFAILEIADSRGSDGAPVDPAEALHAMKEKVETDLPDSSAPSEWAIKADNILYTVHWACLPDGTCSTGDIREQTRITLENLKRTVEAAGGTMADVVQVQVYITERENFQGMTEVYRSFFERPYPNRATIVAGIMVRGGLIEIMARAHIPPGSGAR